MAAQTSNLRQFCYVKVTSVYSLEESTSSWRLVSGYLGLFKCSIFCAMSDESGFCIFCCPCSKNSSFFFLKKWCEIIMSRVQISGAFWQKICKKNLRETLCFKWREDFLYSIWVCSLTAWGQLRMYSMVQRCEKQMIWWEAARETFMGTFLGREEKWERLR